MRYHDSMMRNKGRHAMMQGATWCHNHVPKPLKAISIYMEGSSTKVFILKSSSPCSVVTLGLLSILIFLRL